MAELRAFIDLLRERYGIPYPLAHHRPFVADRQLHLEAQDASHLPAGGSESVGGCARSAEIGSGE